MPRWVVALPLSLGLLLLGTIARAQAPSPLYPDLRTLPPTSPVLSTETIDGETHHVLRFTARLWNAGQGPLELRGESSGEQTLAYQRIYDDLGGVSEQLAGEFTYHPGHSHWHFEGFAQYELWIKDEYDGWLASGRQEGQPRWWGSKTTGGESFCVRDSQSIKRLPGSPETKYYRVCGQDIQGISVGWADSYSYRLPDQWIDLGQAEPPPGRYVLRVIADPRNLLYESENRNDPDREGPDANEATTVLEVAR